MKHLVVPTVNVFIISGTKLLLGRRLNKGWMDGYLCPTGGHVEVGETPAQALISEIKEELGVTVKSDDLEFACVAVRKTTEGETVAFEFIIRDKDYTFINTEPEQCSELVWVDLYALPDDLIDDFRQIITHGIIGKKVYIELGY